MTTQRIAAPIVSTAVYGSRFRISSLTGTWLP